MRGQTRGHSDQVERSPPAGGPDTELQQGVLSNLHELAQGIDVACVDDGG